MPEIVVLLHGFSGTDRAWDGVVARLDQERYLPRALDLPGHGDAVDSERPITFASCVEHVLTCSPERFVLGGCSLGGTGIALHIALAAPERVGRLVLVSTTAGIEDPAERAQRRLADNRLAEELESISLEDFIERWRTQPLFADEPREVGHPRARRSAPQPARGPGSRPQGHRHRRDGPTLGTAPRVEDAGHRAWWAIATPSTSRWGTDGGTAARSRSSPRARRSWSASGESRGRGARDRWAIAGRYQSGSTPRPPRAGMAISPSLAGSGSSKSSNSASVARPQGDHPARCQCRGGM